MSNVRIATQRVAITQTALFGDSIGDYFNDTNTVIGFPANLKINARRPIKYITVIHGGVIDGIDIEYVKNDGQTTSVSHGTSSRNFSDLYMKTSTVALGDNENIIAVSGLHGPSQWGVRVLQLSFAICDTRTGQMRVAGPFGGGESVSTATPQPFRVSANGTFIALGGYAIDTHYSVGQLKAAGENGGLYGLTFFELA
ncbi:hypothetical protein EST38_g11045 [Candolleomyces aberdarensis]|uniref:Jacalin-type lectin domain-containing protein n=1 Tax=Candolleomyces aberdarensis TaxID=2316362 RepID=A0A4V1Q2E5_9AGAR|nr:hypothetical protein EST38_g11045 [Candolleomyces aberdarensis]